MSTSTKRNKSFKKIKTNNDFELTISYISKFYLFNFEQIIKVNYHQQISYELNALLRLNWKLLDDNASSLFQSILFKFSKSRYTQWKQLWWTQMSKNNAIKSSSFMISQTSFDFKACQRYFLTMNLSNDK